MSAAAAPAESTTASQRRFPRYRVTVPVEISVLRSGVPEIIPGRALDLGEGGLSAVLAGELRDAQSVGVDFRLSDRSVPIRARARVRHHGVLQCGLEFSGLSEEQLEKIRVWSRDLSDSPIRSNVSRAESHPNEGEAKPRRWWWAVIVAATIFLSAAAWWRWQRGWQQLENNSGGAQAILTANTPVVPATVMKSLLIHQVAPVYPDSARAEKLRGTVVLQVEISADGSVTHLAVVSGSAPFVQPAMDAVRWWRFQPYRLNGEPTPVQTTVAVEFQP